MLLIVIAHRGEAKEFIRRKHTQQVDFYFSGIFRDNDEILLLTGEGIQNTTLKMASVLTYFGSKIDRVLNMGIAGALDEKLQLNQIYGIREVYHEFNNSEFSSCTCIETNSILDCVTACQRVQELNYARTLAKIAPIVDRELWAVGAVCREFRLPFKSYKLISDFAGKGTDHADIINRASEFGKHLFDFFKKLTLADDNWSVI
jgi:nucleoside phosphorylase